MAMTHTVHEVSAPADLADLDLLAAARHRVKQLVALLETLPFTEHTARLAREYLDEAIPVREAFERFTQLGQAEQQRLLCRWGAS
ncbi:hypothetical protein ACGFYV_26205 [Streptomyces sp. NPDC048297]|uniref:hypothetical protein n=1 Tax=Streptomyces sp. NPDC048297 TaxID=3365531 RepID=UPI003712C7C9